VGLSFDFARAFVFRLHPEERSDEGSLFDRRAAHRQAQAIPP
jgi:hypothetical protein